MANAANYDVIVVGAGHAGCEAALAAARMGARTLVLTLGKAGVALMPCNPSIGGPAKGNLVREIDALGGEMGRNTDRTLIQIRELNTGKGPAVRALRAQSDKRLYGVAMRRVIEHQPGLDLVEGEVEGLIWRRLSGRGERRRRVVGVRTVDGRAYSAPAVIVTTGTFLKGRLIRGDESTPGGRADEAPSTALAEDLARHGFDLGRLKTGTPPRVDARTIDFSRAEVQHGSTDPLHFSFDPVPVDERLAEPLHAAYPHVPPSGWRQQMPCYRVATNERTHAVIRANLHRAPMFNGGITVPGPRYCPSIEDKIVRFADKPAHTLFLEPEGFATPEVYVQGANTSLPADVQVEMIRSVPALRDAQVIRLGYAVEYDFVRPFQLTRTLETERAAGLFLAGQINGTTGYEEAAAQGLMAGINAVRSIRDAEPLVLGRDQAYVGVMIDDLVSCDLTEPYRLHTSRAEYRLLLRHDGADMRLTELGHRRRPGRRGSGSPPASDPGRDRARQGVARRGPYSRHLSRRRAPGATGPAASGPDHARGRVPSPTRRHARSRGRVGRRRSKGLARRRGGGGVRRQLRRLRAAAARAGRPGAPDGAGAHPGDGRLPGHSRHAQGGADSA